MTPAPFLINWVLLPVINPTVPVLVGLKVTELVASTLAIVMVSEEKLTSFKPVPPPTESTVMAPVPAFTVKPCAPPAEVVAPTTVTFAPPDKEESNCKVPVPFNTTSLL